MGFLKRPVKEAAWAAWEPVVPDPPVDLHPKRGHNPRKRKRLVFDKFVEIAWGGVSYEAAAVSREDVTNLADAIGAATIRRYRDEAIEAGSFLAFFDSVVSAYARVVGFQIEDLAVDGCHVKAPGGGAFTGASSVNRGRCGRILSVLVDRQGMPLVIVPAAANMHDYEILAETLTRFEELELDRPDQPLMLHLDAGYDVHWVMDDIREAGGYGYSIPCKNHGTKEQRQRRKAAEKRSPGKSARKRWQVERTNGWLTKFGKIRTSYERNIDVVQAWLFFVQAIIMIRAILGAVWYTHRWEGRPKKNPYPKHKEKIKGQLKRLQAIENWHLSSEKPPDSPEPEPDDEIDRVSVGVPVFRRNKSERQNPLAA